MNPRTRLAFLFALLAVLSVGAPASAAVITRGPYLQRGGTDRVTVRWRTDTATNSRVRYGTTQGSLTLTRDDSVVTTEHSVELTGLSANTRYFYAVGSTTEHHAG